MTKKLKIFIALTLAVQLFVPSFLAAYHYSLYSTAKSLETEYRFEISYMSFDDHYVFEDSFSEIAEGTLSFHLAEIWDVSSDRIVPLISPQNNVISLKKPGDGDKTDIWFFYRTYSQNSSLETDSFSFVNPEEKGSIKQALRNEYSHFKGDEETFEHAYLTAKIYKGLFLPTAIYFKGEKIIDINL
jgi:hypothetical protein